MSHSSRWWACPPGPLRPLPGASVLAFKPTPSQAEGRGFTPKLGLPGRHRPPRPPWHRPGLGRSLRHWIKSTVASRGPAVRPSTDLQSYSAGSLLVCGLPISICGRGQVLWFLQPFDWCVLRLHFQTGRLNLLQRSQPVEPPAEAHGGRRGFSLGPVHHHQRQPGPQRTH